MIDYTQWERKTSKISTLLLDPQNPRIPLSDQGLSQDELLAELIEHDKVKELAKNIVANGYYTDELLIAAPRPGDGKLVVIEGNRRLAALKALLSPDAVPEQHRKKFRMLSAKIPKSMIKSVPVTIAPSRDAALPRIAEKHTRSMLEWWKPAQKARFYQSQIDQGKTTDEICEIYGLARSELNEFLRLDTLYQMACSMNLSDDVQRKVENPRKFSITNLERLMESQSGRGFLGVETDPKHVFKGRVSASEFKRGFAKIVTDVAKGDVTSRVLNNIDTINQYLKSIDDYRPDKSKKGSFTPKDIIKKLKKPAITPTKQRKARTRRSTLRLIPSGLKCGLDNQRIHDVFNELRRLKVTEFPNAIAIMLRVLLELSVSHYIQRAGETRDLLEQHAAKKKNQTDWHPSLNQQLQFLLQHMNLPLEPLERKGLNQFVSSKDTAFTLGSLDLFIHNKNVLPTEPELRAIWGRIEPLMRIVLVEPQQIRK